MINFLVYSILISIANIGFAEVRDGDGLLVSKLMRINEIEQKSKAIFEAQPTFVRDISNKNLNEFVKIKRLHKDYSAKRTREKRGIVVTHNDTIDPEAAKYVYKYYDKVSAIVLGILFGIALEVDNLKANLMKPIGVCIAISYKFLLSPLVSQLCRRKMLKLFY